MKGHWARKGPQSTSRVDYWRAELEGTVDERRTVNSGHCSRVGGGQLDPRRQPECTPTRQYANPETLMGECHGTARLKSNFRLGTHA